ncbi:MAG TPA: FAD-dependent oxidoreductase [Vicinamibacterales bacterium]|nr:FAD-dependent oxidoreductase [Vicinamibacterales bacterium]
MTRVDTSSYWIDSTPAPRFSALKEDIAVDVLVVGAGITGITAAYLLKRAGCHVALVERDRCLSGETSYTTAHLSCVTDTPLSHLVKNFGQDHAQATWDAQLAAIDTIDRNVWREQIKCQFEWVPGYLFDRTDGDRPAEPNAVSIDLLREADLAVELGFDAEYMKCAPLFHRPAVRYENQAKFHPRKYLLALLRLLSGTKGCQIYEGTEIEEIDGTPITATIAGGHRIHCEHVLIATHVPLKGKSGLLPATLLQTKIAPYTSYAVAGWVPRGTAPEALFWDTGDPYDYLRVDRRHDHDFVIFGGDDHKTGQVEETSPCFGRLEQRIKQLLPEISITHRWSGQVVETNDGLPYIGETAERQFVATGFSGNGMTFGTLSAMMFTDYVTGQTNPWAELFDPGRTKIKGGLWNYLKENKDYPYYLIRDRFAGKGGHSLRTIKRGTGEVIDVSGQPAAVYRGLDSQIYVRSAVCTHMGCYVHWNDAERTWDCPCHGSRFKVDGDVIAGPAKAPLSPIEVSEANTAESPTQVRARKK